MVVRMRNYNTSIFYLMWSLGLGLFGLLMMSNLDIIQLSPMWREIIGMEFGIILGWLCAKKPRTYEGKKRSIEPR